MTHRASAGTSHKYCAADIRQFARELGERGWCIDIAGARMGALHVPSNRTVHVDELGLQFLESPYCADVADDQPVDLSALSQRVAQNLPRVAGSTFRPVEERFVSDEGITLANTYIPYRPGRLSADRHAFGVHLIEQYLSRLFPIEDERVFVKQYAAHILLEPLKRPQYGMLITGAPGTGKSLLLRAIEKALGGRHCWRENSYTAAFKGFSEVFPDHLVVTFDDAPIGTSTYEQLKHAITRTFQEVEIKGVQRRARLNVYSRIWILSNELSPFDMEDDRRFYVPTRCIHPVSKAESDEFFKEFVPWLESGESGPVIYHWLRDTSLSGFPLSSPPMTDAKRIMCGSGGTAATEAVVSYVQDGRIVHVKEVQQHLRNAGYSIQPNSTIEKALMAEGYVKRRRTNPQGSGQISLWVPSSAARSRALNGEEIARLERAGVLH